MDEFCGTGCPLASGPKLALGHSIERKKICIFLEIFRSSKIVFMKHSAFSGTTIKIRATKPSSMTICYLTFLDILYSKVENNVKVLHGFEIEEVLI